MPDIHSAAFQHPTYSGTMEKQLESTQSTMSLFSDRSTLKGQVAQRVGPNPWAMSMSMGYSPTWGDRISSRKAINWRIPTFPFQDGWLTGQPLWLLACIFPAQDVVAISATPSSATRWPRVSSCSSSPLITDGKSLHPDFWKWMK